MQNLMRAICRLAAGDQRDFSSDEQVLRRFLECHDQAAFAELMRRHGPMVQDVCRRLLRRREDAEDAFQATFLTLVRKGHSIRRRGALASWLYRVAFHVALRVKASDDTHPAELLPDVAVDADPADAASWRELRPVLDREIQGLPAKYRAPIVLCFLQGKTYEQAATEIGCPKGTVAIRLSRGRRLLQSRLVRRGLPSAAGCVAACSAVPAGAAVPAALRVSTACAAEAAASGAALTGMVSTGVTALVESASREAWLGKCTVLALGVALGLASLSVGVATGVWMAGGSSPAIAPAAGVPVAVPATLTAPPGALARTAPDGLGVAKSVRIPSPVAVAVAAPDDEGPIVALPMPPTKVDTTPGQTRILQPGARPPLFPPIRPGPPSDGKR